METIITIRRNTASLEREIPDDSDIDEITDLVPLYYGKSSIASAQEWIEAVEDIREIYNLDDRLTLLCACRRLKDEAKHWYQQNVFRDWKEFKLKFVVHFAENQKEIKECSSFENDKEDLRHHLSRRNQPEETLSPLNNKKEVMCVRCYKSGHYAIDCWKKYDINKEPLEKSPTGRKQKIFCKKCKKYGHLTENCFHLKKFCDNCERTGHVASQCRVQMNCMNCYKSGHSKSGCPEREEEKESQMKENSNHEAKLKGFCRNCCVWGHFTTNCFVKKSERPEEERIIVIDDESLENINTYCSRCKEVGHSTMECLTKRNVIGGHSFREPGNSKSEAFCKDCKLSDHLVRDCKFNGVERDRGRKNFTRKSRFSSPSPEIRKFERVNSDFQNGSQFDEDQLSRIKSPNAREQFSRNISPSNVSEAHGNENQVLRSKSPYERQNFSRFSSPVRRCSSGNRSSSEREQFTDCNSRRNDFCETMPNAEYRNQFDDGHLRRSRSPISNQSPGRRRHIDEHQFDRNRSPIPGHKRVFNEPQNSRNRSPEKNGRFSRNSRLRRSSTEDRESRTSYEDREPTFIEERTTQQSNVRKPTRRPKTKLVYFCRTCNKECDHSTRDCKFKKSNEKPKPQEYDPNFCRICKKYGHVKRECKFNTMCKTIVGYCRNCKVEGHFTRECKISAENSNRRSQSQKKDYNTKDCTKNQEIERNLKRGHTNQRETSHSIEPRPKISCLPSESSDSLRFPSKESIPSSLRTSRNLSELLKPVRIDNVYVTALVNLASDCTTLQKSEFEKHEWKMTPCNLELSTFGSSSSRTLGKIFKNVCVDEVSLNIDILVVEDDIQDFPLVLGSNFLDSPSICVIKKYRSLEIKWVDSKVDVAPAVGPAVAAPVAPPVTSTDCQPFYQYYVPHFIPQLPTFVPHFVPPLPPVVPQYVPPPPSVAPPVPPVAPPPPPPVDTPTLSIDTQTISVKKEKSPIIGEEGLQKIKSEQLYDEDEDARLLQFLDMMEKDVDSN